MTSEKKQARANLESLRQIFTVPEAPDSTLGRIDKDISQNLIGFLQDHIVAVEKDLLEMEADFSGSAIPDQPMFVSEQTQFLLDKLVSQSVHTASPSFIGHMTSALPYFMLPLSKIMMALNQNMVKIETSKAFTPLERQTIGMLHRLVYGEEDAFYVKHMHNRNQALGSFTSGGTIANITALWVARNNMLRPDGDFAGVDQEGLYSALKHYGYEGVAILVSERGHYSLGKAADVLGIGRKNIRGIATDNNNKVKPAAMLTEAKRLEQQGIKVMAVVGVAGASETGSVDALDELADVASEIGCYYHVDAAWGGPTLFSEKYQYLLRGIKRADSVTIDAHKQLYVPMGAGLVVFRDPTSLTGIEHHAEYIIRKGSKDLGSHTLEGSRSGMAMLVQSGLKIIGRRGYELLINQGIEKARKFADMITANDDFDLVSEPELNILTYRYVPPAIRAALDEADQDTQAAINDALSKLTKHIQKTQRARGKAFVSRTRLTPAAFDYYAIVVFRVVLANPLTTTQILKDILDEQIAIAQEPTAQAILASVTLINGSGKAVKE